VLHSIFKQHDTLIVQLKHDTLALQLYKGKPEIRISDKSQIKEL
jgi:hypothetical protein